MKQDQGRACSSRPQVVGCNPFDFRPAVFYQHLPAFLTHPLLHNPGYLLDLASQAPSANIMVFPGRDIKDSNTYNKLMAWVRFCSFWIYPSLACLLLFLSLPQGTSWKQLLWLIPLGWFIWSLLEYLLHRFFFHWTPHHRRLKQIVRSLHVSHHGDSRNPDKILVRPIYSLTVSALFLAGFYTVTGSFFASSALLTGLWLGFLYYELKVREHR